MKELTSVLIDALRLEEHIFGNGNNISDLEARLMQWEDGVFRLVVMGEVQKGKSSFINALLGIEDLLPSGDSRSTSLICKIRYSSTLEYRAHFLPECGEAPRPISKNEFELYCSDNDASGNSQQIDFIEVLCPAPMLQTGLEIIDTPGIGGLVKSHKKLTYQCVSQADAVFFVMGSVGAPLGKQELEHLNFIRLITSHIYFIQTKSASVDTKTRLSRRNNNLSILSAEWRIMPDKIPYFMVDSALLFEAMKYQDDDDLEFSGFPELRTFIHGSLQANRHILLEERALSSMSPILDRLRGWILSQRKILLADSEEKRKSCMDEVFNILKELDEWDEKMQPEIQERLKSALDEARLEASVLCEKCHQVSSFQKEYELMIQQCPAKELLNSVLEGFDKSREEHIFRTSCEMTHLIKNRALNFFRDFLSEKDTAFTACADTTAQYLIKTTHIVHVSGSIPHHADTTQKTSSLSKTIIANVACECIKMSIQQMIPGLGIVLCEGGKVLYNRLHNKKISKEQNEQSLAVYKEAALKAAEKAIAADKAMLLNEMDRLLKDVYTIAIQAIIDFVRTKRLELRERRKEIQKRAAMESAELLRRSTELSDIETRFSAIELVVQQRLNVIPPPAIV